MAIPKSKRSGGPKTESGKQAVSKNAVKTGAYSSLVVLPGESEQDFQDLEAMLQRDLQVDGLVEASIVHELAVLTWKRMRLERIEQVHLKTMLAKAFDNYEFQQVGFSIPSNATYYVIHPESMAGYNIKEYRVFIAYMEDMLEGEITLQSLHELEKKHSKLFEWIGEDAVELGLKEMPTAEILSVATYNSGTSASRRLIDRLLRDMIGKLEPFVWVDDHAKEIEDAKSRIRDKRLLDFMQTQGVKRAHDDLAKSFYRTLAELRKHQSWRRKNQEIDVTPDKNATGTETE